MVVVVVGGLGCGGSGWGCCGDSGCICVFLEWDQERQDLIMALKSHGVPVLILVLYQGEIQGSFGDDTQELIDDIHFIDINNVEEALALL